MSEHLTEREQEVLTLVCERLSDAEIGRRLTVSTRAAESHVHHIFEKLGVHSRKEARRIAKSQ